MQAKNTTNGRTFFKSLLLVGILALALAFNVSADGRTGQYVVEDLVDGTELENDWFNFNELMYIVVKSDRTRRYWLDRNLGATDFCKTSTNETCSATTDDDCSAPIDDDCESCLSGTKTCYGDLYQWGRAADGHELRTSLAGTTLVLPKTLIPPTAAFIIGGYDINYDWTTADVTGAERVIGWAENICPKGYRVPTEWEVTLEGDLAEDDHFLYLPLAGKRMYNKGNLKNVGLLGYLWTKSVFGSRTQSSAFYFTMNTKKVNRFYRSNALSVRCIQELH